MCVLVERGVRKKRGEGERLPSTCEHWQMWREEEEEKEEEKKEEEEEVLGFSLSCGVPERGRGKKKRV